MQPVANDWSQRMTAVHPLAPFRVALANDRRGIKSGSHGYVAFLGQALSPGRDPAARYRRSADLFFGEDGEAVGDRLIL